MPAFPNNKFRGTGEVNTWGARYRALMNKHPFLTFGLPFISVMVAASFVVTPATAVRYERNDRKVRQMTTDETLNLRRGARKVDMKEEYYRLAAKDLDDWQQRRVKRLPGEPDGIIE
ncbi:hypothetical protein S40285_06560 [Stachybotrys chlorohalonatus IBT 40285]|uniref:Cytochrome c oxidase assembly protein COX16, mitochondrial n=2 Tax=Stachybotrys TaxID=74721 RepID=A0A084QD46_STAC4|nr:hypothetical protein S7711_04900 [Stachybotrys chartarum IBT 7711]KFA54019.1 hypothetical protein S40293_01750 [Stachybotrys chartarum IBT 40293]KFA61881.1 hypothetical protein S40285_06560 [Stachybotrys chlorohalonata IBT 40285]KFA80788.1 hypothetical protein S40288_04789 [Stachybotrys chartarum IBT 40288]